MGEMRVARTLAELADARGALTGRGPVGVVMTMGALHEGHATLMHQARREMGAVVATIFVNPLQFAPGEDLDRYPRPVDADLALCEREGVDLVFMPSVEEMYPSYPPVVRVTPGAMGTVLEGAARPTHFEGVLTVVLKLMHLTQPDVAYFGQKDAQQLALVRRMVWELDVPVEVRAVPIVRDEDGMARSSRNAYLSPREREQGLALSRALRAGLGAMAAGRDAVLQAARAVLDDEPALQVDYLALVDPRTLTDVGWEHHGEALLLVAARAGTTRLIDNTPIVLGV